MYRLIDYEELKKRYKKLSFSNLSWVNEVDISDCIVGEELAKRITAEKWLKERRAIVGHVMALPEDGGFEEPTAKWINKDKWVVCSNCGCKAETQYDGVQPIPKATKYCPDCGRKMIADYEW